VKFLTAIQHTSAGYLGLIEDHLEGRRIGFKYHRPFTESGKVPAFSEVGDGLVLLGGGPWGSAGGRDVPSLKDEVALARACFMQGLPIIGIGLGAQIICLAADGKVEPTALKFGGGMAKRVDDDALNGFMPETYPNFIYMRDRPIPPGYAKVLSVDEHGQPAAFQIGENVLGFTGHPGFKRAMAEDLIMEFEESPVSPGGVLDELGQKKHDIADALVPIMTGIVQMTGLMGD
jgi:GMP synthase-like glutamine amidotransferase